MKKLKIMLETSLNKKTRVIYSNGSVRAIGLPFINKTPTEKTMSKMIRKSNYMSILENIDSKVKRLLIFK